MSTRTVGDYEPTIVGDRRTFWRRSNLVARAGFSRPIRPTVADGDAARVAALTRRPLRWLVVTSIASRVALTVPTILLSHGVLGSHGDRLLPLMAAVVGIDGLLLMVVLRRPELLAKRWVFAADLGLTLAVTVAATQMLPPGAYLLSGADALTGYAWGTVGLWTLARGWRAGVGVTVGFAVLQFAMARLNGAVLDADGVANIIMRISFALMAFVFAAGLAILARRGAVLVVAEGMRAGRLAERASTLRALHDTALADLDAVVLAMDRVGQPLDRGWAAVDAMVAWRSVGPKAVGDTAGQGCDLTHSLDLLAAEFAGRGLTVVRDGVAGPGALMGDPAGLDALVGAAREALNNVAKHAGVPEAVLRVWASTGMVEVDIVDSGLGFATDHRHDGYGLAHSMTQRMADVGGRARVRSAPGHGTRVLLRLPVQAQPDSPAGGPIATPIANGAVSGFALLPLVWRILALPVVALMVGPFIPGHRGELDLAAVGLFLANVALLVVLAHPKRARLLGSSVLLMMDLVLASAFFLWTATLVPPDTIIVPNPDGAWTYVMATVPLWVAARGVVVGWSMVAGAAALEAVAMTINHAGLGPSNQQLAAWHIVLLVVAACSAVVVMRWARRGGDLAVSESLRAGREAERVEVLADLHRRVLTTWELIDVVGRNRRTERGLAEVRGLALGMAADLRAALRADRVEHTLVARLEAVATNASRQGVRVELVVTELSGEPPPDIATALAAAVRAALPPAAGPVVIRVSGSTTEVAVAIRDQSGRRAAPAAERVAHAAASAVGVRSEVSVLPGRGTRVRLSWAAP